MPEPSLRLEGTTYVFVDESKAKDYLVAAALVASKDLNHLRSIIRALRMRGQSRIHMKQEGDARRREILTRLATAGVKVVIYRAGTRGARRTHVQARADCLRQLVEDCVEAGVRHLRMESDQTMDQRDRQTIHRELQAGGGLNDLDYSHHSASEELLLCIPDAVAWAYAKGGEWSKRATPLLQEVVDL